MCGIYVSISKTTPQPPSEQLKERLQNRGPDAVESYETSACSDHGAATHILVYATVLSLRGDEVTKQPLLSQPHADESRSFLCWNGEAWSISGQRVTGNDSQAVFKLLLQAAEEDASGQDPVCDFSQVGLTLDAVQGPFAFVFFDARNRRLTYGRDRLGRRSLVGRNTGGTLTLSSVAGDHEDWLEVDAGAFRVVNWQSTSVSLNVDNSAAGIKYAYLRSSMRRFDLNRSPPAAGDTRLNINSDAVKCLEELLVSSLAYRLCNLRPNSRVLLGLQPARVAVLFSGGIDCTVLARLIDDQLPLHEPIDLLNVAFENPRIHSSSNSMNDEDYMSSPYEQCPDRITARSSLFELQTQCRDRKWRLIDINVPFAETELHRPTIVSLMRPHRTEMDLSIACALYFASRGSGILRSTEGQGEITTPYTTAAQVLISGLGADELFGGYQRHALAFTRRGHAGLIDELDLDITRLGKRNLGRDDRVLSHWGREARYPFLDEGFVLWAVSAPVWHKCGFGMHHATDKVREGGHDLEDGKLVLRLLAWKLGMRNVAEEKKRAIQFGARTAKMSKGKSKGTDAIT